jgi:hypothetical protein
VKMAGGVLTNRECEVLVHCLHEDGLITERIPGVNKAQGIASTVSVQG